MLTWFILTLIATVLFTIAIYFGTKLYQVKFGGQEDFSFGDFFGDYWKRFWIPVLLGFLVVSLWGCTKEARESGNWHAANTVQCSIQSKIRNSPGAVYSWWEGTCLYPTKTGQLLELRGFRGFGESGEDDGDDGEE